MEAIGCSNFSLFKSASLKFHRSLLLLPLSSNRRFLLRLSSSMAIHPGSYMTFAPSTINPAKWRWGLLFLKSIQGLKKKLHFFFGRIAESGSSVKTKKKAYDGLLLDAGGTLLQLQKPVEETYAEIGRKYGLSKSVPEIKQGFKRAFSAPWPEKLRYQGDGRLFWKLVVSEATGCDDERYFEEVYEYYANGYAWHLPNGAQETLLYLKNAGVKLAVVSNFDTRLRKLLKDLNVLDVFDAVLVSSEVGFEKPDARIFKAALDQTGVGAHRAVHVGDDEDADKMGANAVGIDCWLWGNDVKTFSEVQDRILVPNP